MTGHERWCAVGDAWEHIKAWAAVAVVVFVAVVVLFGLIGIGV